MMIISNAWGAERESGVSRVSRISEMSIISRARRERRLSGCPTAITRVLRVEPILEPPGVGEVCPLAACATVSHIPTIHVMAYMDKGESRIVTMSESRGEMRSIEARK
jgi:hypothetical protein